MGITRYGTRSCPEIYSVSCNRKYVTKYFSKYVYNFSRMSIIRRNNRRKIHKHTTPAKEAVNRITDASAEDPRCVPPSLLPLRAHDLIRSSSLSCCFRVFSHFSSYSLSNLPRRGVSSSALLARRTAMPQRVLGAHFETARASQLPYRPLPIG